MKISLRRIRAALGDLWWIERNIRLRMAISKYCHNHVPLVGRLVAALIDRRIMKTYGLDVTSWTVDVKALAISHPVGVLIGGNGLYSPGRVSLMAGVKLVGRGPLDPDYLARHAKQRVFVFGDNVVIGANSTVVGPIDICDNVVVAAMSLVNKSITEPGIYGGVPARRLGESVPGDEWVSHLRAFV